MKTKIPTFTLAINGASMTITRQQAAAVLRGSRTFAGGASWRTLGVGFQFRNGPHPMPVWSITPQRAA